MRPDKNEHTHGDDGSKGGTAIRLQEKIIRHWARALGSNGVTVLSFVAARTVFYNKAWERITGPMFMQPFMPGEDERHWHTGLAIGRSVLFETLARLESMGVLLVERKRSGNWYSINKEWEAPDMAQMRQRKAGSPAKKDTTDYQDRGDFEGEGRTNVRTTVVPTPGHRVVLTSGLQKEQREKRAIIKGQSADAAQPQDKLRDTIEAVRGTRKVNITARQIKFRQSREPAHLEERFWRPEIEVAWPEHNPVKWTKKCRGQWRNFAKQWPDTEEPMSDFVCWCVHNWRTVYATKFAHVPEVTFPEWPDAEFLYRMRRAFVESWQRRDTLHDTLKQDEGRRAFRKARRAGHSYEESQRRADTAVEASAAERAVSASQKALEMERKTLAQEKAQAEAEIETLRKAATKVNPGAPKRKIVADPEYKIETNFEWGDDDD